MGVLDYFRPVSTLPAEKIRAFLNEKKPGEYNLVDVRQPQEYEQGPPAGREADSRGGVGKPLKGIGPE